MSYEPQNVSIHIIFHTQVAHTYTDTNTSQYEKNGVRTNKSKSRRFWVFEKI